MASQGPPAAQPPSQQHTQVAQMQQKPLLEFPLFYFTSGGAIPTWKPEGEVAILDLEQNWPWRESRPLVVPETGDTPFQPDKMTEEMEEMRRRLYSHTSKEFWNRVKENILQKGIRRPDGQPMLVHDVKDWIKNLDDSPANHLLVYDIFHKFNHQDKGKWRASVVDSWFVSPSERTRKAICPPADSEKKRKEFE